MRSEALESAGSTAVVKRNYARLIEQTWIWSMVGYSILRFFIAWGAFSEHGANIWVFGLVDVGTAWPYGKSVAVVCKRAARSEYSRLPLPLVAAVTTFFAPYAYLWFAAGAMPNGIRVGMAICVSVLLLAASAGVLAKTRKLRREAATEDSVSELVIDVRTTVDAMGESSLVTSSDIDDAGEIVHLHPGEHDGELVIDLTNEDTTITSSALQL